MRTKDIRLFLFFTGFSLRILNAFFWGLFYREGEFFMFLSGDEQLFLPVIPAMTSFLQFNVGKKINHFFA
ncbi:MAG: hypothetical protein CSA95_04480 [Bacteroidetes bacterium]|nr:MAG: hypothetical protein CSA95_04480 [Bacteroidota bacterium]